MFEKYCFIVLRMLGVGAIFFSFFSLPFSLEGSRGSILFPLYLIMLCLIYVKLMYINGKKIFYFIGIIYPLIFSTLVALGLGPHKFTEVYPFVAVFSVFAVAIALMREVIDEIIKLGKERANNRCGKL